MVADNAESIFCGTGLNREEKGVRGCFNLHSATNVRFNNKNNNSATRHLDGCFVPMIFITIII